jgi:peptidoglycan/xylan/chitin deacetylase (PgdA/CDA1 family)
MIFILTYHKVSKTADKRDFYTVFGEQLKQHVELLRERGCECLRIEELIGAQTVPPNKFILTFDDGTADHHETVLPLLQKLRCPAAFFIPTAKLNRPGYLADAQVKELSAAGHTIGSHSHEHKRLDVLPPNEIKHQIVQSREIIAGLVGVKPITFVPPGGFTNAGVRQAAAESGIKVLRTMRWGRNRELDLMALETLPLNHYTDRKKFISLLESDGRSLVYAGKEALKRLLPLRNYEQMRRWMFKFLKPD